jgi:hypothetical protein
VHFTQADAQLFRMCQPFSFPDHHVSRPLSAGCYIIRTVWKPQSASMSHCVALMNKRSSIKSSESIEKSDGHSAHEIGVTLTMHSGSGDFTDFIFAQPSPTSIQKRN